MNRLAHLTSRRFQSTSSKVVVPVGAFASVDATRASLPPKVAELLREYPSVITLPVQWGEQDSYGHLNNVYYCRYFESGRLAHFEQVGSKFLTAEETERFVKAASYKAVGPIVKSVNINYRKVVDYPDTVTVGIKVPLDSIKKDRFDHVCRIVSHKHEAIVADGTTVVVTYDYATGTKAEIPANIVAAIRKSEESENK